MMVMMVDHVLNHAQSVLSRVSTGMLVLTTLKLTTQRVSILEETEDSRFFFIEQEQSSGAPSLRFLIKNIAETLSTKRELALQRVR